MHPGKFGFCVHAEGAGINNPKSFVTQNISICSGSKNSLQVLLMRKPIDFILKYLIVIPVLMTLGAQLCAATRTSYEFQAQYDKVFNGVGYPYPGANFNISVSRLSGDGRILAFAGSVTNPNPDPGSTTLERYIVIMSFDGTEIRWIDSPINPDDGNQIQIKDIAMSHYGENIFFSSEYSQKRIYVIQDGQPREILNTGDYWDVFAEEGHFALVSGNETLRTTYDGKFVYFLEGKVFGFNDIDIWRIDDDPLTPPELVLDDNTVMTNGGNGRMVRYFDVSHSGHYVTFILVGDTVVIDRNEVFTMIGDDVSTIRKLTAEDTTKYKIALSDDGSTIVFGNGYPVNEWVGMDFDGSNRNVIAQMSYNIAGPTITANGDTVFYYDQNAAGGSIVASNGRGHYPLFPNSTVDIASTYDPEISANSSRVSFRTNANTLYSGKLNLPMAFSNAPVIETIQLDPPFIDMNDPDEEILLTSRITDPQDTPVMSDIERTSRDHLLKGDFVTKPSELPVWFSYWPNDNGTGPDEEADDNIFTSISSATGYDPDIGYFTLRVGAQDADGNVAIADTILGRPDSSCSSDTAPVIISPVIESGEPMFCVSSLHIHIEDIVVSNLNHLGFIGHSHLGVYGASIGLAKGGTVSVGKGSTMSLGVL